MVQAARENLKTASLDKTVTVIEGDALKVLPTLEGEFDFVFIDALKKDYLKWNKGQVADDLIIRDMTAMSKGRLKAPENLKMIDIKDILSQPKTKSQGRYQGRQQDKYQGIFVRIFVCFCLRDADRRLGRKQHDDEDNEYADLDGWDQFRFA